MPIRNSLGDDGRPVAGRARSRSRRPARRYLAIAVAVSAAAVCLATAAAAATTGSTTTTPPTVTGPTTTPTTTTPPTVQPVTLPADQGAHPGFGIEWWYTTGTLTGANHRPYFWFATIWSAMGGLVARVNVVDLRANRVVLSDSYLSTTAPTPGQTQLAVGAFTLGLQPGGTLGRWDVDASTPAGDGLKLDLIPRQPAMLHGHDGIIQQGTGGPAGYYSLPRLATRGTLTLNGKAIGVSGLGWFDHQWGNFETNAGALKWNWFACQYKNGTDLMLYQFLNQANRPSGLQSGTILTNGGGVKQLTRFTITPVGPSIRPAGAKASYPLAWQLRVPADKVDITIRARARNQFITNQFVPSFWEAASEITSGATGTCTVESSRELPAM